MLGANIAAAASPPAPGSHEAGVVLDSSTNSNSNADTSRATGSNSSNGSTGSTGSTGADVPKGLESFYNQDLTWTDCTDDATGTAFQCATVTVPLDYDNPQGQTITVALKKLSSTSSSPRGSVFLNPGGPGGSGISAIESQAELYKSGDLSEVLANYDVIGFDPRGVGQSTPITCWTPEDVQAILAGQAEMPSLSTPGSAADIVKKAMIDVDRALSEQALSSRILLQIHDELLVEVAPGEAEAIEDLLKEQMERAAELSVPLDVAVGRGRTWREAAH